MRILEIIPQLSSGGGERFTVDLCNELSKRHKVKLIVLHSLDDHGFYLNELSDSVEVISMKKKSGLSVKLMFVIMNEIDSFNPDIVHSHLRGIMYTALSSLIKRHGKRYFHTVHSDAEKEAGDKLSRIFRKFLFKFNFIKPIAISDESLKSFEKFYGYTCRKINNGRALPSIVSVSLNMIQNIQKYKKTSSTRLIINLARIMGVKRQPLIARVCKRLQDEGYDFLLLFIGRAEDNEILQEIQNVRCDNIKIIGETHTPLEYLKLADAYCLFSEFEGMPISLIEALGTGTIPICTPVGGITNVIEDGVNGFLAKDISEEECYIALKRFLDLSKEEMDLMKIKSLQSYGPYSMEDCAQKYEEYFIKTLEK